MDIEKSRELWDRLENEPERAYRAFESYRNLPSKERTLIAAYRQKRTAMTGTTGKLEGKKNTARRQTSVHQVHQ
jgi:hypothetical protein